MMAFLGRVLPGESKRIDSLRRQIVAFCSSLTAKCALIRGPIGSGKSTVARVVGLLKRVAPLGLEHAQRLLDDARFDVLHRIDLRYIPWYVELPLTGLVETLAESQLFGVTKGAFTGAREQRPGIFELAAVGRMSFGKEPAGALLTGGVVFLDEIGDLSLSLQAKLLPVLAGAPFYRIGGEGKTEHEIIYRGATLSASWRNLDDGALRPDLLSRVSSYILDVPGIDDRREDLGVLMTEVERLLNDALRKAVESAMLSDASVDRGYWQGRLDSLRPLTTKARRILGGVEWGQHGNLRGLTSTVEQILVNGREPEAVVSELPRVTAPLQEGRLEGRTGLLDRLLQRPADGDGIAGHLRAIEVEDRRQLQEYLLENSTYRRRLAGTLRISEPTLLKQIQQLDRRRRLTRRGESK
jgi:DNA-binding NtrC family response regulator